MRIHHLQHVPFEGLGSIESVLREKGHQLSATHLYAGQPLPSVTDIDWLIVMGGPMGVHDEESYPWLKMEKQFIRQVIESGKIVLGICLGAQLIAAALGAKVYRNQHREIGWFKISRALEAADSILATALPDRVEAFHWHGDSFDIPAGAKRLAASEACRNQGFILEDRIVGLQFHLETTLQSAAALIANCKAELDGSRYVQTATEMLADNRKFATINQVMLSVLDMLENQHSVKY